MDVPDHLKEYFSELQPIFKNTSVGRDDIGPFMKDYCEHLNFLSCPRRTLVGSYFGQQMLSPRRMVFFGVPEDRVNGLKFPGASMGFNSIPVFLIHFPNFGS